MSKKAYAGLLILTVLLVLLMLLIGYLIWGETCQAPTVLKYDILKDTLTITLTILAAGIAVVGYLVYQILSGRLQIESELASRRTVSRTCSRFLTYLGHMFWDTYIKSEKMGEQYLEIAIELTNHGLRYFNDLPEDIQKKHENERLLCDIKNNLAYYLAERKNPEDKDLAKECAEYIRKKTSKFLEAKEAWEDTCRFVDKQYPD